MSPIDRVFAVVATPWPAVGGVSVLAALHLMQAQRLLQGSQGLWSVDSLRAVGVGVVAASGLAMAASRLLPALQGAREAQGESVAEDLSALAQDVDLEALGLKKRSRFEGRLASLGALLLFVGLLGYALLPLVQAPGLGRGGSLVLSPGTPAEAAMVVREGQAVRENLGGWRFEIDRIEPHALAGLDQEPGRVHLRLTRIQTGEETEAVLQQNQLLKAGGYVVSLESVEPAPRPAGVWVKVTDTAGEAPRSFDLKLTTGRTLADPEGPGRFQVRRIEERYLGGSGAAVQGVVQLEGEQPQDFWLFERSATYDARHRGGRYRLEFKELVPGHVVSLRLSQPEPLDWMPIWIICLSLGTFLLMIRPQVSLVRDASSGDARIKVSSLNEAERAGEALLEALLPPEEGA